MPVSPGGKVARISLAISGLVFFTGGVFSLNAGQVEYGVFQLLAGAVNLILLSSLPTPGQQKTMVVFTFLLNIIIAVMIAWDYLQAGTRYLHYAWLLAALFSLLGMLVFLIKSRARHKGSYGLRKE